VLAKISGRDDQNGNVWCTSNCVFSTSRPPLLRENKSGGLQPQLGGRDANHLSQAQQPRCCRPTPPTSYRAAPRCRQAPLPSLSACLRLQGQQVVDQRAGRLFDGLGQAQQAGEGGLALAVFKQADVVFTQARLVGQGLVCQAHGLAVALEGQPQCDGNVQPCLPECAATKAQRVPHPV